MAIMIEPIDPAHSAIGFFRDEENRYGLPYSSSEHSAGENITTFPGREEDELELSPELRRLFKLEEDLASERADELATARADDSEAADESPSAESTDLQSSERGAPVVGENRSATGEELTEEEQRQVRELERVDREVRQHEQAHVSAGGQYVVGGIQLEYQTGPDGKSYAVGGEVRIDSSAATTPEETIKKAEQVRRAAMAPAEPSGQDMRVAAAAEQMAAQAKQELSEEQRIEVEETQTEQRETTTRNVASTTMYGVSGFDRSIGSTIDAYS